MPAKKVNDADKFLNLLETHIKDSQAELWSGTLREYIQILSDNPSLHMGAHKRILRMIESNGIERDEDGEIVSYNFFEKDLFGIEDSIEEVMSYLRAAAAGSEVGRRILLLYGPTSSGKSQLAILLKRGLERFSRTDEGAIYSLVGTPMNEDPLAAIPLELREEFLSEYGIKVEGELSPLMELILSEEHGGNFLDLPVRRFFMSERGRAGVGTFVPSDKKSQDISELVGSMDLSTIGKYGSESDPRAYRFDGELNIANRGMMEFVEMLKVDQKFLYVLLTLAQEKNIKTGRFPLIYADEFILAHSIVGDEPVPYRKNGVVKFNSIANLTRAGDTDIQVIAMNMNTKKLEWTNVSNFYSHPFTGNLIKTIQKNGIVETTYNHSIYSKNLEYFYPEDELDIYAARSIPEFSISRKFTLNLSEEMEIEKDSAGIQDVEGSGGNGQRGKNYVKVSYDLDKDPSKVKDLLKTYACYISEDHGNSKQKIPDFVFNLPSDFIEYFLDELIKGDGSTVVYHNASENYENRFFRYKTVSKMLAAQVGFLTSLIGKDYSIYHSYTSTGKDAYGIRYRSQDTNAGSNKIEKLFVENKEVYDIACVGNHSFIAGVGQVLCHNTNETEYKRFLGKDEMEALHDRTIVVRVPYNLRVDEEIRIYEKLINQASFEGIHIAPHALRCAALFAVLSRLKDSDNQGLSIMGKMKLYNGEDVEGFSSQEIDKFKSEFEDEGMQGISPRYVINRISARLAEDNTDSITPIDVIRSLKSGLKSNPKVNSKEELRLESILTAVIEEYNKLARNDVQKAFFVNFESEINNLLKNYLDHIEGFLEGSNVEDEWGESREPDERLMRSIEEKVQVSDKGKSSFRQEIYRKMLRSARNNDGKYNYKEHPKLREALEKQLFDERQDVIRLTVSSRNPDEEELKRVNVVIETLCDKYDYNVKSANQLLRYVSSLMARN